MPVSEAVETSGHLMDTGLLAKVLDDVLGYGGDYRIDRLDVGRAHDDESHARITVSAEDDEALQRLLMRLQAHGVNQVDPARRSLRDRRARRRLPRRLLLHDQPRDRRAPRIGLGAGRAARDGLRPGRHGRPGPHRARSPTCGPATRSSAAPAASRWCCRRAGPQRAQDAFEFMSSAVSQREAAGAAGAPDRPADARGQGRGRQDPLGRRSGRRAHRRRARHGRPRRGRLRRRAVRRQRPGHARHRVGAVRHVARRRPRAGQGRRARPRAPHPGHQPDPQGRLDRRRRRARACSPAASCTRWSRTTSASCWSARCATTARCRTSTPTSSRASGRCVPSCPASASRSWSRRCCTRSRPATSCPRRSRWSASTSTRRRSPSWPTAAVAQAVGIVTDIGLFLEELARELVPGFDRLGRRPVPASTHHRQVVGHRRHPRDVRPPDDRQRPGRRAPRRCAAAASRSGKVGPQPRRASTSPAESACQQPIPASSLTSPATRSTGPSARSRRRWRAAPPGRGPGGCRARAAAGPTTASSTAPRPGAVRDGAAAAPASRLTTCTRGPTAAGCRPAAAPPVTTRPGRRGGPAGRSSSRCRAGAAPPAAGPRRATGRAGPRRRRRRRRAASARSS